MSDDGFPPFISAQLRYLLIHSPEKIKVEQVWSGGRHDSGSLDRFTLVIPYCLDTIKWDVIFNAEFPMAPPDVIFGPEDEDFHPFLVAGGEGEEDLSSRARSILTSWDNKDNTRLLALIQELRECYMSYQRKRVAEVDDERVKFEISTILSREGIEMHISSVADKPEEVKFAVPLMDMKLKEMVQRFPWRHPQRIYLRVIYPVGGKYTPVPSAPRLKLISTPELGALFSVDDVKLPSWCEGMCMAEYLPHLEESLEKQVLEAVSLNETRRQFIEALAPLLGRPVEADPVFCRKATFFTASGNFAFLVHVIMSTHFPKQQPTMMLQSSQYFQPHGAPVKSPLMSNYPWSPRWEASNMAEKIFDFLVDEAQNFKRYCNESQLQQ